MGHSQYPIHQFVRSCAIFALLLPVITYAQNSPSVTPSITGQTTAPLPTSSSLETSVGGVKLSTPTDVSTCGKLPIVWVFQDPGLIVDDAAFITRLRVWVTNIGVDQSPIVANTSPTISPTLSTSSTSAFTPNLQTTSTSFTPLTTPPFGFPSVPLPSTPLGFPRRQLAASAQKRQQASTPLNITITQSHPLLGYLNLTWSPVILPPNSFYQLWMESVNFNKNPPSGLAVRSSSGRFFVSSSADQACLAEALTRSSSATDALNTSEPTSSNGGIQGGAIAGVVIGVLVGVGGAALLLLYCMRKRKQTRAMRSEKGILGGDVERRSAAFFGMTQRKGGKVDHRGWGASTVKHARRNRADEFGSKDSTAPAMKYHGRSASGDSGLDGGAGSTESTIAGTYEGFKPNHSKNASSNDLHYQYAMHGRKSGSVTSFGPASATIPGSIAGHSIAPSYSYVEPIEGTLVEKHGRTRDSYDGLGRRNSASRERSNKPARMPSVRSTSVGGRSHAFQGSSTQEPQEYPMNDVEPWSGPLTRERTRSLPGGAAPPTIGRSGSMTPTGISPTNATGNPVDPTRATSPTGKIITKPNRKPAPAYPEGIVQNSTSPPPVSASTRGFYPPSHGASTGSLNSLANRSTGNLDTIIPSSTKGRKMSTGSAGAEFSGFMGAKDGPVHYLIPDMPPSNTPGR